MPMISVGNAGGGVDSLGIKFNLVPILEADADAQTFVCEFTGGASANETGVGGGLTGADLVLTQYGSVPGAVDGGRNLADVNDYFMCTPAALNRFNMGDNLTIIYQCSHLTANGYLGLVNLGPDLFYWNSFARRSFDLNSVGPGGKTTLAVGCSGPSLPAAEIFWHVASLNYTEGVAFTGIAVCPELPTKMSDFVAAAVGYSATHHYTSTTSWSSYYKSIVGSNYLDSALVKMRSLTLSELPFVSLR